MLNFISTPIGNLNDISQRAIDAIRSCDYLYAEDTRVTQKLLKSIDIKKLILQPFKAVWEGTF